jgi:hypothetical protein
MQSQKIINCELRPHLRVKSINQRTSMGLTHMPEEAAWYIYIQLDVINSSNIKVHDKLWSHSDLCPKCDSVDADSVSVIRSRPPPATDHHHHHHQVMSSLILVLTELDFVDVGDIFNIVGNLQTFYLHICIASCL